MKQAIMVPLILVLCFSMVGCAVFRDGLEQRPLTVEEQIRLAETGLEFARMAYQIYLEHRDTANPEEVERGQVLLENIFDYIERIQQLKELAEEIEASPRRE